MIPQCYDIFPAYALWGGMFQGVRQHTLCLPHQQMTHQDSEMCVAVLWHRLSRKKSTLELSDKRGVMPLKG